MKLSIVTPCYNEEEVLEDSAQRLIHLLSDLTNKGKVTADSRIYFVDDGSVDKTWQKIEKLVSQFPNISGIKLSRNRGHQNALLAGLVSADGDIVLSIDADLQDDTTVIERMIDDHMLGAEIVFGVRKKRDTDSLFKRSTAGFFYWLLDFMKVKIIRDHADFRLMSRKAIEGLKQFSEVNLFLRGLVPLIGYQSSVVYYDRQKRLAGETKYPLRKMLGLALNGITSFSVAPLRVITMLGFIIFGVTLAISLWILWARFFSTSVVPGWASTVLPMYFLGGIQLLCIGVIGEYLGKVYQEVKARPRYIIEKII